MIGEFRALAHREGWSNFLLWAAGEIFVVVAGVLIAFALNAWWGERAARLEEQTHLRTLATDFERNVGVYGALLERAEGIVNASSELLQLALTEPDSDSVTVRRLVNRVFTSLRERPALDAYEALVNSAGLALIRDDELRSDLAGFADRARDPYYERFSDQLYMAFTTQYIGRLQIAGTAADEAAELTSYGELLRDPAFREHLAFRFAVERDVASQYRERLREAESILEQLRADRFGRVGRPPISSLFAKKSLNK